MLKLKQSLALGLITTTAALFGASSAQALDFSLNWTGSGGASLTGSFSGTDLNTNDLISTSDVGEISAFNVTFFDALNNPLITYNLSDLQSFSSPSFNFNYQVSTGLIAQSGNNNDPSGFAIGDSSVVVDAALLQTVGGTINFSFADAAFTNIVADSGGTLTATPVPFESGALPTVVGLSFLGAGLWFKRRQSRKVNLPQ